MALKKFCKCGKIILKKDILCDECKKKYNRDYNKDNKSKRKDFEKNKFYSTARWIKTRDRIRLRDRGICMYCYLIKHNLSGVECVHHIVPFKEDDSLKYDKDNLICLCRDCHDMVHNEYEVNENRKLEMQETLKGLVGKLVLKV